MVNLILRYAKAILSGGTAFVGALATANADDAVTSAEWVWVIGTTLIALGLVAAVPNKKKF